ncbi:MAG: DNA cytosine methyltransferase [Akkermansia sp.]|nr:DNA cytosine methyltransferase [Akkermansia sp.]
MRPLNVLSLCDGIACGAVALRNLGIPVNHYYGSEIKKAALKLTRIRWPDHVELGDVNSIAVEHDAEGNGVRLTSEKGSWYEPEGIDLFLCGSPCQSFSSAMPAEKRIGLKDPKRSGLFLVCHQVFKAVSPRWYLWENVASMRPADKETLSRMIGCEPVFIDSADFSAQMRKRLYWTNIPLGPRPPKCEDTLQDILESGIAVRVRKRKDDA